MDPDGGLGTVQGMPSYIPEMSPALVPPGDVGACVIRRRAGSDMCLKATVHCTL